MNFIKRNRSKVLSILSLFIVGCFLFLAAYSEITPERIVGHNQIAPERKTDPGEAFDWDRFYKLLDDN